jgi:hypothetical protein
MIGESFCPHCDMGIVPTRSKLPWTHKFRKCQHCHGDWRNYVKKPEPQPDVHPTNHMDALPPMEEYMVSQFNALSQKESDAYSKMLGLKFTKRAHEHRKASEADEYNQLMDLTLTYRQQDVYVVVCPNCYGVNTRDLLQDPKCKLCLDGGNVKVVYIKPAP